MNLEAIRDFVKNRLKTNKRGHIIARESSKLDFKQSFIWGDYRETYMKTMVAFANNQGGLLIFGVQDSPHKIIGLSSNNFSNTTPETISESLKSYFSSIPLFEMEILELNKRTKIGWIYIYEHDQKPIVCTKSGQGVKDGDIYFRNNARSERINSSQLLKMIDDKREKEKQLWLAQLERMAKVGVENAAVLNVNTGELSGNSGRVVIDEELLKKIKFIKEGRFEEKDGSPTLRVIGDITGAGTIIERKIDPEIEFKYNAALLAEKLGFKGSSSSKANNGRSLAIYYGLQKNEYMHIFKPYKNSELRKYNQKALDFLLEKKNAGEFNTDTRDHRIAKIRRTAARMRLAK